MRRTIGATDSITGTSVRMPTPVAGAAPDRKPNSAMADGETAADGKTQSGYSAEYACLP